METCPRAPKFLSFLPAILISATLFLTAPNLLAVWPYHWQIFFFSTGTAALLALGLCCFAPLRLTQTSFSLTFKTAAAVLTGIVLWQLLRHREYSISEAGRCFAYLSLPLFGCLYRKELETLMPWCAGLLWLFTCAVSVVQYFDNARICAGLPMNINWNAALITATMPFALLCAYRLCRNKTIFWSAAVFIGAISGFLFFQIDSDGAKLALAAALVLCAILSLPVLATRKKIFFGLISAALLGAVLILAVKKAEFQEYVRHDDRSYFYQTTPRMIAEKPWFGHGIASFEQAYLPYRSADYFTKTFCADRVNHPHNHLLFMAAGLGVAGLAAWLVLVLFPLFRFAIFRFRTESATMKIAFFSCVTLFLHAQLDLILYQEPTNLLALLLLGMIMNSAYPAAGETAKKLPKAVLTVLFAVGAILSATALERAAVKLLSSIEFRAAYRNQADGRHDAARKGFRAALEYEPDEPYAFLFPAIWEYCQANTDHPSRAEYSQRLNYALSLCERFDSLAVRDYSRINYLRGGILLNLGRFQEAEKYLLRDASLYPLDTLALRALRTLYLNTDRPYPAALVGEEMNRREALRREYGCGG